MEKITIDNYINYIGKEVDVEIYCYEVGIMYPDNNVLVGMNFHYYYFHSEDDNIFWHYKIPTENKEIDCSIEVYSKHKKKLKNEINNI